MSDHKLTSIKLRVDQRELDALLDYTAPDRVIGIADITDMQVLQSTLFWRMAENHRLDAALAALKEEDPMMPDLPAPLPAPGFENLHPWPVVTFIDNDHPDQRAPAVLLGSVTDGVNGPAWLAFLYPARWTTPTAIGGVALLSMDAWTMEVGHPDATPTG